MTCSMREWVEDALAQCALSDESLGYLLARGASMEVIESWSITTWVPPSEVAPDEEFRKRHGTHGGFFEGRVVIPLWSPRGTLLGFDSRAPGPEKRASRYMIGDRPWCVCWIGIKTALPKIWQGDDPWIVEGAYDAFPLMLAFDKPVLGCGPARLVYSQLEFLRRFCKFVNLAFDRDPAGRKGTERAMKDLTYRDVGCRDIPYGKTGDDIGAIWDGGGVENIRREFPY